MLQQGRVEAGSNVLDDGVRDRGLGGLVGDEPGMRRLQGLGEQASLGGEEGLFLGDDCGRKGGLGHLERHSRRNRKKERKKGRKNKFGERESLTD